MPLTPGSGTSPAHDSMARAIEEAFLDEWHHFSDRPEPSGEQLEAMRHIFVAVARGVVRHLAENPTAFVVDVDGDGDGTVTSVETQPPVESL